MHLYPIIYQNPSAKSAGLSRVTSRLSTLACTIGWSWCWRSKSQVYCAWLAVFSLLTCGFSWWFSDRAWVHFSHFTITDLERRWSANSFLSLCLSIFAWAGSLRDIILLFKRELVLIIERLYPSWYVDERRVIAVAKLNWGREELRLRYVRF